MQKRAMACQRTGTTQMKIEQTFANTHPCMEPIVHPRFWHNRDMNLANNPSFLTIFEHSAKPEAFCSDPLEEDKILPECFSQKNVSKKSVCMFLSLHDNQSAPFSDALNIAKQYLWCPAQKKT